MLKGVTMTSSLVPTPDAWERAARLIDSGAVDLEAAISEVISLDRWADAFEAMEDGIGMKILLVPRVPVN
jgi:threonine dehydrogenase-like Zn-dependent dehydrogenase